MGCHKLPKDRVLCVPVLILSQ
ncbi:protein of unknown function [Thiomonas sp. Bio17B3]|nr:protein of unknown function [Thiomonas sp. Bio17B3]VDY08980.1 protein of unknown function [Thiomonas sp. Sup16B3]VDY12093.1 protein of unknown function [Thiomonas sp. OC7]VDY18691.1 protein of unknown function [Thiomonas sp. CB2]